MKGPKSVCFQLFLLKVTREDTLEVPEGFKNLKSTVDEGICLSICLSVCLAGSKVPEPQVQI